MDKPFTITKHAELFRSGHYKSLEDCMEGAIADYEAEIYAASCRQGTAPRGINNPEFIRHCAPEAAPDL